MKDETFLSRWSRKKAASAAGTAGPTADAVPAHVGTQLSAPAGVAAPAAREEPPAPLPPVESLTPESDFTPFMKAEVDPALKRQAFKKLIEDPQFNVMDGLDVYIDDYSKADPLPEGWLEKMNQVKHLGIFRQPGEEAEEVAEDAPETKPEPMQKATDEQALADARPAAAPDTSGDGIPPLQVGKSGGLPGGV